MISLSLEVIRHCKDYEDVLNAFLSAFSSVISISKLLLHRLNWRHKLILVESIVHDWTFVKDASSRDIMLKYARKGRLGAMVFLSLGCASCVFLFSSLLLSDIKMPWDDEEEQIYNKTHEKKLLLAAYCVFSTYTSFAYGLVEILQSLQIFVNCISQCGNDGFFFTLTMHTCGQFEVLRMDFAAVSCEGLLYRAQLDNLLKRHHRLIRMAHHLKGAFDTVILA
ncbi:hypothetical protein EAI_00728 [Harpegnathos saltator]|uniref:Odorant receptor 13a n=1 Tax=Harpegnathos saltator TaxID=610380 RepID=E2B435_HARSA|nr:hypothetical protein EAI_00728 [Harpegnathos saltator]